MQLAAKARLHSKNDFYRLLTNESLCLDRELIYTDYYFDSPSHILHKDGGGLRLRVPEVQSTREGTVTKSLPLLTLKDNNKVESGDQTAFVYSIEELSETMVKELLASEDILCVLKTHFWPFINDPANPVSTIMARLQSIEDNTKVTEKVKFVVATKTHRRVYKYGGITAFSVGEGGGNLPSAGNCDYPNSQKIHLDETEFPFGKLYEVEFVALSTPSSDVRMDLENFLGSLSVEYSWSLDSKYSNLMKYIEGLDMHNKVVTGTRMSIENIDGYTEVFNWLKNHCHSASIIDTSTLFSQALSNVGLEESATNEYFHATGGEAFFTLRDKKNMFTQSQQHWSQRGAENNAECRVLESFHTEDDRQEYQENYYFDDALNGTLQMHSCLAELRCINQGSSFILSLKKNQCVVNGSQSSTTNRCEISGDVARHLLREPTNFLHTMREHNGIAAVLWDEYCLRELHVVAFYRTKRSIFSRPITAKLPLWAKLEKNRQQIGDDDDVDTTQWGTRESLLLPSAMAGHTPTIDVNLDHTLVDCVTPATHFSAIAAKSPSCCYATVSDFKPTANCISLYEVEVAGIGEDFLEPVKNWLVSKLRKRGVGLQMADKTKLQKYMDFLFELQHRQN